MAAPIFSQGWAAIAAAGSSSVSTSFQSDVHKGSLLITFAYLSDVSSPTCADTAGNSYTLLDSDTNCVCYWAIANASGPLTVTVTTAAVSTYTIVFDVWEFRNNDVANPIYSHALVSGNTGSFPFAPINTLATNLLFTDTIQLAAEFYAAGAGFTAAAGLYDPGTDPLSTQGQCGVFPTGSVTPTMGGACVAFTEIEEISINELAPPVPLCNNPPVGMVGVPYSQTFLATGGTPPYAFAIVGGSLPPGLVLAGNGVVSGTPTTAGIYPFVLEVIDSAFHTSTTNCSITINPPLVPLNVEIIVRGVKRLKKLACDDMQEGPEMPHVKRAV